ncbi:hypothetical protein [Rufibacter sp. LB8]|uniref:hypothetical protein n=1 Tax=Rufibacter sp. LB8 TaxID=2777781 RepID=UPI00178C3704|nr:hypothetical protein [Rufibacter sp. LB8]
MIERSVMVGGSLSGSYRSIKEINGATERKGNAQQYDLDAKVGYFFMHDFALGVRGNVRHERVHIRETAITRTTYVLLGPFARYYLNSGVFAEASFAMGVNNVYGGKKSDINEFRGGVGYALFINPKVAIEPAVMFSRFKQKFPAEGERSHTEFGPSLNLGLQVYLFRERKLAMNR